MVKKQANPIVSNTNEMQTCAEGSRLIVSNTDELVVVNSERRVEQKKQLINNCNKQANKQTNKQTSKQTQL
jgi:hypothetical protein